MRDTGKYHEAPKIRKLYPLRRKSHSVLTDLFLCLEVGWTRTREGRKSPYSLPLLFHSGKPMFFLTTFQLSFILLCLDRELHFLHCNIYIATLLSTSLTHVLDSC